MAGSGGRWCGRGGSAGPWLVDRRLPPGHRGRRRRPAPPRLPAGARYRGRSGGAGPAAGAGLVDGPRAAGRRRRRGCRADRPRHRARVRCERGIETRAGRGTPLPGPGRAAVHRAHRLPTAGRLVVPQQPRHPRRRHGHRSGPATTAVGVAGRPGRPRHGRPPGGRRRALPARRGRRGCAGRGGHGRCGGGTAALGHGGGPRDGPGTAARPGAAGSLGRGTACGPGPGAGFSRPGPQPGRPRGRGRRRPPGWPLPAGPGRS